MKSVRTFVNALNRLVSKLVNLFELKFNENKLLSVENIKGSNVNNELPFKFKSVKLIKSLKTKESILIR